jgi:hypothetical protein
VAGGCATSNHLHMQELLVNTLARCTRRRAFENMGCKLRMHNMCIMWDVTKAPAAKVWPLRRLSRTCRMWACLARSLERGFCTAKIDCIAWRLSAGLEQRQPRAVSLEMVLQLKCTWRATRDRRHCSRGLHTLGIRNPASCTCHTAVGDDRRLFKPCFLLVFSIASNAPEG